MDMVFALQLGYEFEHGQNHGGGVLKVPHVSPNVPSDAHGDIFDE